MHMLVGFFYYLFHFSRTSRIKPLNVREMMKFKRWESVESGTNVVVYRFNGLFVQYGLGATYEIALVRAMFSPRWTLRTVAMKFIIDSTYISKL